MPLWYHCKAIDDLLINEWIGTDRFPSHLLTAVTTCQQFAEVKYNVPSSPFLMFAFPAFPISHFFMPTFRQIRVTLMPDPFSRKLGGIWAADYHFLSFPTQLLAAHARVLQPWFPNISNYARWHHTETWSTTSTAADETVSTPCGRPVTCNYSQA